jgi:acetylornithine deacetylase/succinyl-diaminopimelate desuccinylase-like protein
MKRDKEIHDYIAKHAKEAYGLLLELAAIPAPSNHEEKRARFCKDYLERQGAKGVYIDDALNVVYPVGCEAGKPVVVFMAHTDVVFADTDPLPVSVGDGRIRAPGIGDDTANLVALLLAAKYIAEEALIPEGHGVVIVANAGEEGLGNLKGSRRICADFGPRISEFFSFDGYSKGITTQAVGSKRYRVEVLTEGGHSYNAFGNRSAIAYLASMIDTLYELKVPERGKTTFNVGVVSGGTSVNTIAQQAEMLYEFRSDSREDLAFMESHFNAVLESYRAKGITVNADLLGERPCSGKIDEAKQGALTERVKAAVRTHTGIEAKCAPGSTDCNIPLSLGIPSICLGCVSGDKAHTYEEWIDVSSLEPGYRIAFEVILDCFFNTPKGSSQAPFRATEAPNWDR